MKSFSLLKIAVFLVLVSIIIVFIVFDLERFVSLSYIKESQAKFQELTAEHPLPAITSYMIIYILVTSLSLPGATVLTLLG
ncbi:MAG: TVP38/TMEM64 family protein, partial [Thermodesulfobacteriota bacterium]|nr:TVP38/TMEM64 family protein [Thermodesulfobacteriota bacterium]